MNFEVRQIREIVARRRPELLSLVDQLGANSLKSEEREALRGAVADELIDVGLDNDDEPTADGLALERLIDLIGRN